MGSEHDDMLAAWIAWGRSVPDPLERIDDVAALGEAALVQFADAVLEGRPDDERVELGYRFGCAFQHLGMNAEASRKFGEVAALRPGYADADARALALEFALMDTANRPDAAAAALRAAEELAPEDDVPAGARLDGLEIMLGGRPCNRENVEIYCMYASELRAVGRLAEARQAFLEIDGVVRGFRDAARQAREIGEELGIAEPPPKLGTGTLFGMSAPVVQAPRPAPAAPRSSSDERPTPRVPMSAIDGLSDAMMNGGGADRPAPGGQPEPQGMYRMSRRGTKPPVEREELRPVKTPPPSLRAAVPRKKS